MGGKKKHHDPSPPLLAHAPKADGDSSIRSSDKNAVSMSEKESAPVSADGLAKEKPVIFTQAAPVITAEGKNTTEHKHHLSVETRDDQDGETETETETETENEDLRIGGHSPMGAPSPPASFAEVPLSTILADEKRDKSMDKSRIAVDKAKHDNTGRVYRVYCDGVFDMFHLGHMRMLEQAKKSLGDVKKVYLLCGVCDDEMVHKYKGKTVMNHKLRCDSVSHCRWVDQVVPDAPWVIDDDFINKYKIDFVAHDALPYADASGSSVASGGDVYAHIKERGMFLETQRTDGLSTSDLIVQIVRDYDDYVLRNLDRGYTKEQLNVGATWELRSKMHVKNKNLKAALTNTKANYKETSDAIKAFVSTFNPKYLMIRSESKRRVEMKPGAYYRHLRQEIPQKRSDIIHHSVGLARALMSSSISLLSYFNLASYCRKTKTAKTD